MDDPNATEPIQKDPEWLVEGLRMADPKRPLTRAFVKAYEEAKAICDGTWKPPESMVLIPSMAEQEARGDTTIIDPEGVDISGFSGTTKAGTRYRGHGQQPMSEESRGHLEHVVDAAAKLLGEMPVNPSAPTASPLVQRVRGAQLALDIPAEPTKGPQPKKRGGK